MSVFSQPVLQLIPHLPEASPLVSPPLQTSPLISFHQFGEDSAERAVNEVDQLGDIFHSLYESVLFGLRQHVSFKIKSPEGSVYLYDLLCEKSGRCDVKIQSRTKNKKGNPTEAIKLFSTGNGDLQFIQPELKVKNTSSEIIQSLKGVNSKLKLVDELWVKTYKMKDIGEKKRAQFVLEVLRAHNKLREHHGTASLTLEKKLMEDAQSYAERCAKIGHVAQRGQVSPYGENIWGLTTNASNLDDLHGGRPVEKWYSEIRNYTFGKEPADNSAGHLTQLLWNGTKYMGVGLAANDNGQIFVICEYYPPGNYLREHAANVKPLQKPFTKKEVDELSIPILTNLTISKTANQIIQSSIPARNKTKTPSELDQIELYTLHFHNVKRKLHSLRYLNYSKELESLAQDWAEHLLANGSFYHRPDNKYGENIYYNTASFYMDDKATIEKAVAAWYDEIDFYKRFDEEPTVEELTGGNPTGHFTQVVWNGTTHVGLGIARQDSANSHLVVVVANYSPAGNILGKFKNNVPRPISPLNVTQRPKITMKRNTSTAQGVSSEAIENEDGGSLDNLFLSNFMPSPPVSVVELTTHEHNESGVTQKTTPKDVLNIKVNSKVSKSQNLTSKAAKPSTTSITRGTPNKELLERRNNATKNATSKGKPDKSGPAGGNSSEVSGNGLSIKSSTSKSESMRSTPSSNIVIRREVKGLKMFSDHVSEMRSTPVCPEDSKKTEKPCEK